VKKPISWSNLLLNGLAAITAGCALATTISLVSNRSAGQTPQPVAALAKDTLLSNWGEITARGHWIGSESAPVVIAEFGDFECPYCAEFEHVVRDAISANGGKVSLVFRHWPLRAHRFAYPAARASECAADQGMFLAYHDLLFDKRDSLGLISFDEMARRSGVPDLALFKRCDTKPGSVATIDQDASLARAIGAHGTPAVIVNGLLLARPPDSAALKALIAKALGVN
jgi:protein-disulfide isomerase